MKTDFERFVMDARISILSMARPKAAAIQKIRSYADTIDLHLALIAGYPGVQEQKHWRKEVSTAFINVLRLAKSSSVPSDVVFQLLYEEPFGTDLDLLTLKTSAQRHMQLDGLPYKFSDAYFNHSTIKYWVTELLKDPMFLWNELR